MCQLIGGSNSVWSGSVGKVEQEVMVTGHESLDMHSNMFKLMQHAQCQHSEVAGFPLLQALFMFPFHDNILYHDDIACHKS